MTCTGASIACLLLALTLTACGGSGGGDGSSGDATHAISIRESVNLDAGETVLLEQQYASFSNGDGIGLIQAAATSDAQPANGYRITTIDLVDSANNTIARSIDFSTPDLDENATTAQLAAYLNQQSTRLEARASTQIRLTLSNNALTFDDFFTLNGTTITGASINAIAANIDRQPNITANANADGEIFVTATDGNDLRLDLSGADDNNTGTTATITSYLTRDGITIDVDSITLGDNQAYTRATVGGELNIVFDYPFQLANAGAGNVFGSVLPYSYSAGNNFDANDPNTYNHATAIGVTDSQGEQHVLLEYFVKADDLGGTYPNHWNLYVLIDGFNVGVTGTDGEPMLASFDIVFDNNGQLDTPQNDPIEIEAWAPRDESGAPNGAATTRITIDISGSTQFGGEFSILNVSIN